MKDAGSLAPFLWAEAGTACSPAPLGFAGSVITISGRMTFTSNKSMEIEVFVDADPFVDEPRERYRAVSAFFTYVSLSKEGKPLPVPQLLVRALPSPSPAPPGAHATRLSVQQILFPPVIWQENMSMNEAFQSRCQACFLKFLLVENC